MKYIAVFDDDFLSYFRLDDNGETLVLTDKRGYTRAVKLLPYEERPQGRWNTQQVACILAELFGDTCACNYCGIDEWLPKKCDFANKECPDVVGVACWEQFLKHKSKGEEE